MECGAHTLKGGLEAAGTQKKSSSNYELSRYHQSNLGR